MTEFEPQTVKPVACHCADFTVPASYSSVVFIQCSDILRGGAVQTPPSPKFRSFDEAEPNSQFHGKYIRKSLIRIRVSLICKLRETPG
jgi:hypothetical protein